MTFTENPPADDAKLEPTPPAPEEKAPGETASAAVPPPDAEEPVKVASPADAPPADATESDDPPVPLDDFTDSGASPEPDGAFNEPPPVPEVIDPSVDAVLVSRTVGETGTQTILLDRDGDGLFETRVDGVDLGDGTFKVVGEPELLDQPFSSDDFGDAPAEPPPAADAPPEVPPKVVEDPDGELKPAEPDGDGDGVKIVGDPAVGDDGGAPEPPTAEQPPGHEPPAGGPAPPGDVEVDLPELYDAPPAYASGADGNGPVTPPPDGGDPEALPVGDPGVEAPEVSAAAHEQEPDDADEPIVVNAEGDGDDAGLVEKIVDAVHDAWDDTTDVVT